VSARPALTAAPTITFMSGERGMEVLVGSGA